MIFELEITINIMTYSLQERNKIPQRENIVILWNRFLKDDLEHQRKNMWSFKRIGALYSVSCLIQPLGSYMGSSGTVTTPMNANCD